VKTSTMNSVQQAECCWALANSYFMAASHLLERQSAETFLPSLFLLMHSLELHLKAFLLSQGIDEKKLRSIGHDLLACLRTCNEQNFSYYIHLSWVEQLQIVRINAYYRKKELEYFVPQAKRFGDIDRMKKTVDRVGKATFNPVTAESFRALSRNDR
jgi:hypothetical protein